MVQGASGQKKSTALIHIWTKHGWMNPEGGPRDIDDRVYINAYMGNINSPSYTHSYGTGQWYRYR